MLLLFVAAVQQPGPRRGLRRLRGIESNDKADGNEDDAPDKDNNDDEDTDIVTYKDRSVPKKGFKESISEPYLEGTSNMAFQPIRDPSMTGQNMIPADGSRFESGIESLEDINERVRSFSEDYNSMASRLWGLLNADESAKVDETISKPGSKSGSSAESENSFECEINPNPEVRHDSDLSSKSCEPVDPVREARLRLLKWLIHEYGANPVKADEMLQDTLELYKNSKEHISAGEWLLQHFQHRLSLEHSGLTCSLDEMPTPCPSGFAIFSNEAVYQKLAKALEPWHRVVDRRLFPTWQTRMLTICGKWDVKNLTKWQNTEAVSQPIAGQFYALKTLRDVDPEHCPKVFAEKWSDKVFAIVDVSLDRPVYTPHDLEDGGIQYRKLPMVSKEQPSKKDVRDFVQVVDELKARMAPDDKRLIGVHCHYGFNRTGFLLVSYLAEKKIMSFDQGIAEFALKRKPRGIKHKWFLDELAERYGNV